MSVEALLDHLSLFESLITLPPEQLMNRLQPFVAMFTAVGRFVIFLLFAIHSTAKLVTEPVENFRATFLSDVYILIALMAVFGNTFAYGAVIRTSVGIFDFLSDSVLNAELVSFKGSFRTLIDTIAEQSKHGVDFFNIKAASASVLTLFLSIAIILLLVTYYVFVSVGMFQLLVVLAVGPVIAGFLFFFRSPFRKWLYAVFACLVFPVTVSVAVAITNQADLLVSLEEHLIAGSLLTALIQMILAVAFLDLVIAFHAAFFGVRFMNIPVIIKTGLMTIFGMFHASWLNFGFMVATNRKGK